MGATYQLQANLDRASLRKLLLAFEDLVKREQDRKLAQEIRAQILDNDSPRLLEPTLRRLARWCKTDGIYADAMYVARKISELLFGRVISRDELGE